MFGYRWFAIKDGDPRAFALMRTHYSFQAYADGRRQNLSNRNRHCLSSQLILEAEQLAWQRWPGERFYTYVNSRKIESVNPGYCFKLAGWQYCGLTVSRKLHILEKQCPIN